MTSVVGTRFVVKNHSNLYGRACFVFLAVNEGRLGLVHLIGMIVSIVDINSGAVAYEV